MGWYLSKLFSVSWLVLFAGAMALSLNLKSKLFTIFCSDLQLRRGADRAEIYSLAFSPNAQWLGLSSDKGTVHVFSLKAGSGSEDSRSGEAPQSVTGVSPPKASGGNGNGNGSGSPLAGSSLLSFASGNPGSSFSFMKGMNVSTVFVE
jgi:hypothetical protein